MIVKWTTVKPIISRVVRNIKANMDVEYIEDLPVWISEAVMKMRTVQQLELKYAQLTVQFHMAQMPCDISAFGALLYNGRRMLPTTGVGPIGGLYKATRGTVFTSQIVGPTQSSELGAADINTNQFYTSLAKLNKLVAVDTMNYYRLNYNKVETNIESGELLLYYYDVIKDEEGFAMIPDNEDYKTALYWYCRMMMIGAGYNDRVFDYKACEDRWNIHSVRAVSQITYPSPDELQRMVINNARLVPVDLWSNFGSGGPEPQFLMQ